MNPVFHICGVSGEVRPENEVERFVTDEGGMPDKAQKYIVQQDEMIRINNPDDIGMRIRMNIHRQITMRILFVKVYKMLIESGMCCCGYLTIRVIYAIIIVFYQNHDIFRSAGQFCALLIEIHSE